MVSEASGTRPGVTRSFPCRLVPVPFCLSCFLSSVMKNANSRAVFQTCGTWPAKPPCTCLSVCRDLYLTYALMVLESFNYFSTSLLFVLYLTQEFGVSDIQVPGMAPAHTPRPAQGLCPAQASALANLHISGVLTVQLCPFLQAGTLYGLWGTLLVVYGIVFSSIIDLFGAHGILICTSG